MVLRSKETKSKSILYSVLCITFNKFVLSNVYFNKLFKSLNIGFPNKNLYVKQVDSQHIGSHYVIGKAALGYPSFCEVFICSMYKVTQSKEETSKRESVA